MNQLLPMARKMILAHGEILPFGALLCSDNSLIPIEPPDISNCDDSQEIIDNLIHNATRQASDDTIIAVGIVIRCLTPPPGEKEERNSIQIYLEHIDGLATRVFFPYRRSILYSTLDVDKPFAKAHNPFILPAFSKNRLNYDL